MPAGLGLGVGLTNSRGKNWIFSKSRQGGGHGMRTGSSAIKEEEEEEEVTPLFYGLISCHPCYQLRYLAKVWRWNLFRAS